MSISRHTESTRATSHAPLVLKILANRNRYAILDLLLYAKTDLCVHGLAEKIGISQPATSHQLTYLETLGVVSSVRMGKTKCYMPANTELARKVAAVIRSLS